MVATGYKLTRKNLWPASWLWSSFQVLLRTHSFQCAFSHLLNSSSNIIGDDHDASLSIRFLLHVFHVNDSFPELEIVWIQLLKICSVILIPHWHRLKGTRRQASPSSAYLDHLTWHESPNILKGRNQLVEYISSCYITYVLLSWSRIFISSVILLIA